MWRTILAVMLAIATTSYAQDAGGDQAELKMLRATVKRHEAATRELDALRRDNARLRAENDDLKKQLDEAQRGRVRAEATLGSLRKDDDAAAPDKKPPENEPADTAAASPFGHKGVKFSVQGEFATAIGEVVNNTGSHLKMATLKLNTYDAAGSLSDIGNIVLLDVPPGATRSFEVILLKTKVPDVASFKIEQDTILKE